MWGRYSHQGKGLASCTSARMTYLQEPGQRHSSSTGGGDPATTEPVQQGRMERALSVGHTALRRLPYEAARGCARQNMLQNLLMLQKHAELYGGPPSRETFPLK